MLLNRHRKLWFCADPSGKQSPWRPLERGLKARTVEQNQEKLLFFELGKEEAAREEILSTVKVITFLADFENRDENLLALLELDGKNVALLEQNPSEKDDDSAICYRAALEVSESGSGRSEEPQELKLCFHCFSQEKGRISISVNGISFTAEN